MIPRHFVRPRRWRSGMQRVAYHYFLFPVPVMKPKRDDPPPFLRAGVSWPSLLEVTCRACLDALRMR